MSNEKDKVLEFINLIRGEPSQDKNIYTSYEILQNMYTKGDCYRFVAVLKFVFAETIPVLTVDQNNHNHCLAKINNKYYDVTGEIDIDNKDYILIQEKNNGFLHNILLYGGRYIAKH
jgi:hypothetical protein